MLAKLVALVLPLGLDTFAVAAALGMVGVTPRERHRISAIMVGFEMGMPLVGLGLGAPLGRAIGGAADYLAIGVLLAFGLYTLFGRSDEDETVARFAGATGWHAILLGVSISLDELAVGFTLGLLGLPVVAVIVFIGVQTLIVAQLGLRLGDHLSAGAREGAERLAGLALTTLALVLLAEKVI